MPAQGSQRIGSVAAAPNNRLTASSARNAAVTFIVSPAVSDAGETRSIGDTIVHSKQNNTVKPFVDHPRRWMSKQQQAMARPHTDVRAHRLQSQRSQLTTAVRDEHGDYGR